MKIEDLRSRLAESPDMQHPVDVVIVEDSKYTTAYNVIAAYQNANKWLDTIKEYLLMDVGSIFFSNYIHNLAHTMPGRFDKFGDILHTAGIKIKYPSTEALGEDPIDMYDAFSKIFDILDSIKTALLEFIKTIETNHFSDISLAVRAEELLVDIDGEYTNLYRMQKVYSLCPEIIKFDQWVAQYLNNLGTLID